MPKDFTSTTFSEVYRDDYSDSAGYHKILFNSGRPLQARELTQLQTILQEQIKRFADNIFLDGASVGASGTGLGLASYIQLGTLPGNVVLEDYVGVTLQGPSSLDTSGLQFLVSHVEAATSEDPATLFGTYISSNQSLASQDVQNSSLSFSEGDTLSDVRVLGGGSGVSEVTVKVQPGGSLMESTGRGLLFGIKSAKFWTQGHFVFAPQQLIAVSKYSDTADLDVGFEVIQDIVTVDDTDELYDNQGAVPNLSSPGADRYRIRLVLSERGAVIDPNNFVYFASIRNGQITQVSGANNKYNEIEKRMAVRHFDTNGNFEVSPFDIRYLPGDSDSVLTLVVPGTNQRGANPTAFLDGFRLQHFNDEKILIKKPVSSTSEDAQATPIAYKNYVNTPYDSADVYLGNWTNSYNLKNQTKMSLLNLSGVVIGNARVKHLVNTLDSDEGYRVHLYDVKMKSGQNARDVVSFRPYNSTGVGVKITLVSGQMYAVDPEVNVSFHNIPGGRVKSLSNVNMTVQRQFTATSNGSSQLQITTGNNEAFDDLSRWVFINTTTGAEEAVVPSSISLNSSTPQTATVTVSGASENYVIYAYIEKNSPQPKTKTYARHGSLGHISASSVSDSGGNRFQFGIYDGISLVEARADSAGGRVITDLVTFDGGQRDNYYGPVVLKPDGLPSDVSTIHARFEYFDWGASGDYFSVNSYVLNDSFSYSDIPVFTSPRDGEQYDMRNNIDFRPKMDPYADTMSNTDRFETPRDGDNVSYDVEWYNRRIDHISLGYNQNDFSTEIRINSGPESLEPQPPASKVNEMVLYSVEYGGNTLDAKDLTAKKFKYKRFRMSDIAKLEDRVGLLEETVSLSFLEQEAVNLVELNSSGDVRSKTGFFVDDFSKAFSLTASMFDPYWVEDDNIQGQSLYALNEDVSKHTVGAKTSREAVQMLFDENNRYRNRTGLQKRDVVRKGDLLYIDYKEVLDSSLSNEVISWFSDGRSYEEHGWYNVNPFNVFTGEGFLKLSPATDMWNDTYHLPDRTIVDEEIETTTEEYINRRNGNAVTPTQPPGTRVDRVTTTSKSYETINSVEEDVIAYSVPFARQREVFGKVQGLRPNTRYWPFFDGTNVEQWTIAETEIEHKAHLSAGDHLRGYPEVDVSIRQHPRKTTASDSTLISDYKGDLFFSFWLPNNAPVPSPNSNSFGTIEEWESWIDAQRKEASKYPYNVNDPQLYDDIGWKFRTGSVEFLLNDVSVSNVENGLSNARTVYVSSGSLHLSQKTVHMTRVTETKKQVYVDPLAQSFMIDGRDGVPGAFVTKIDVFMRKAPKTTTNGGTDLAIPLQLQIREVENGVPVGYPAGEQFRVYKSADEVYERVSQITNLEDIDDVLTHPVTFEFPEPIYLEANQEYAMVLLAECDDYEAFVSTTYDLILGRTEERVNKQPASGSLFLSQNGSTWTPKQNQNLAYRIYTAKFKSEATFNLYNDKYGKYLHNADRLSVDLNDMSRMRVNHLAHGLGVGDKVGLKGLDSATSYLGLTGSTLMDTTLVVDSADTAGYFVQLPSSFDQGGWFGADSVSTNQGFNYDRATYNVMTQEYPKTSIDYTASLVSGVSHAKINLTDTADPRFDNTGRNISLLANREIYFNSPKYLANPEQELDEISTQGDSSPSVMIGATMRTQTVSTFGGPKAASVAAQGYVSDVSPILDLQRSLFVMENVIIDNQPVDSASASALSNTPAYYVPETHPTMGSSPSKHITKPVVLNQSANGLRVFLDMFRPASATVEVYYRTTLDPDQDIYEEEFVLIEPENEVADNVYNPDTFDIENLKYNEYRYLIGGEDGTLSDFTKFQLKVVMKSTNTCETPFMKSIRAIALI